MSGKPNITSAPCATTPLSLACLRQGLPAVQARGYDDLSAETLARFEAAHVGAVEPGALRQPLPRPFSRSCAQARRRVYRTRIPSRSASLSFTDSRRWLHPGSRNLMRKFAYGSHVVLEARSMRGSTRCPRC